MKNSCLAIAAILMTACSSGGSGPKSSPGEVLVAAEAGEREVEEGSGLNRLTVSLAEPPVGQVSLDLVLTGTAAAGEDYVTAGVVVFAPGVSSVELLLTITQDDLYELNESIEITLQQTAGDPLDIGSAARLELSIIDDDRPPTISFEFASSVSLEGTTAHSIQLILDRVSGLDAVIDLDVDPTSTASESSDFTLSSRNVFIPAGILSGEVLFQSISDGVSEGEEHAQLRIISASEAILPQQRLHDVTIIDGIVSTTDLIYVGDVAGPERPLFEVDAATGSTRDLLGYRGTSNLVNDFAVSPDRTLVAMELVEDRAGVWLADIDGSNLRPAEEGVLTFGVSWSSDGSHFAYLAAGFDPAVGLLLILKTYELATGTITEVVHGAELYDFKWSPVANRLAVTVEDAWKDGNLLGTGLFAVNANGSNFSMYSGDEDLDEVYDDFAWSDDGSWIAYRASPGVVFGPDLYLADDLAGTTTNITGATHQLILEFAWQPGGRKLAFRGAKLRISVIRELFIVDASDGTITELSDPSTEDRLDPDAFAFSPDGSQLAFLVAQNESAISDLVILDIDTGDRTEFKGNFDPDKSLAWSPSGEFVVVRSALLGLTLYDIALAAESTLVALNGIASGLYWAPDSAAVAYQLPLTDELFAVHIEDGRNLRVGSGSNMRAIRWSPDSTRIAWLAINNSILELFAGLAGTPDSGVTVSVPDLEFPGVITYAWQ